MIESLDLGNINVLLQLPCAILICKRPPAHKVMSDYFIRERIISNSNIQDTFNFNVIWVKWLFFFYLHGRPNTATVPNNQWNYTCLLYTSPSPRDS